MITDTGVSSTSPVRSNTHVPYIAAATRMPELTDSAVIIGALLGIVFDASSL